jgi:hypothetical protein
MFRAGLPEEARRLFEAGFTPECPGMKAIGYREFFIDDGSGGWALARDMSAVEILAARNSRRYAKRQMTFFASLPEVRWIDIGGGEEAEREGAWAICRALEEFLGAGVEGKVVRGMGSGEPAGRVYVRAACSGELDPRPREQAPRFSSFSGLTRPGRLQRPDKPFLERAMPQA